MSSHVRHLLFVGPRDRLPRPLEDSLSREFPDLAVHITSDWGCLVQVVKDECLSPALILLDDAYAAANSTNLPHFQEMYPNTNLCLTLNGDHKAKKHIRECLKTGVIHNVLPMNLRLDLWLFAVQILLHGGSYSPPDLLELLEIDRNLQLGRERNLVDSKPQNGVQNGTAALSALTPREREVLTLLAQGQQNKNIAAALSLSEHTIKLHIHHIISKMGVSNRTEAAAALYQNNEMVKRRHLES